MESNGVNYYKGVLLCSRPNQSPSINKQKPFCGRVVPKQQMGLVPTKQYDQHKTFKRNLPVLSNHKKWLQKFKKQVKSKQEQEILQKQKQIKHLEKIKLQGQKQRQKLLKSTEIQNNQNIQVPLQNVKPKEQPNSKVQATESNKKRVQNPHKKKLNKPAWALTQKEAQQKQQEEVDELINFFQQGQVQQVKDYVTDQGIKKILTDLKVKIQQMKNQGEQWKNDEINRIRESRQNQQVDNRNQKDDILSKISRNSGSQSVTSQKTAQRVQQLQKKKQQQKDWQKLTVSEKTGVSVDEQIAKNIADQILRNYPNLKHHSNQSIRKLLQKQARQQLKA